MQKDLNIIHAAYKDLLLSINPEKSQLLLFSVSPETPQTVSTLCLGDVPIPVVPELKYLGFILDRRLN